MSVDQYTFGMTSWQALSFRNLVASNLAEGIEFSDEELGILSRRAKGEITHEEALALSLGTIG